MRLVKATSEAVANNTEELHQESSELGAALASRNDPPLSWRGRRYGFLRMITCPKIYGGRVSEAEPLRDELGGRHR